MLTQGLRWVLQRPRVYFAAGSVLALAVLIGSAWVPGQKTKTPVVVVLPCPYTIPPQKVQFPDRWIPYSWGWLWRVKEAVLGKAKVIAVEAAGVDLDSVVFGMQQSTDSDLASLLEHPDFTSTNGVKVWLLPNRRIRELRKRFQGSAGGRPGFQVRVMTADKVQASVVTSGPRDSGDPVFQFVSKAELVPVFRGETTDLTFVLESTHFSSSGRRTDLAAAVRVQLPPDKGFFLLDSRRKARDEVESAILVTAERQARKPVGTGPTIAAGGRK